MKTIVVGAGGGGISSALLSAMRGESVTLYESHSALGGCASWFKRGPFIFDAGATTLSGLGVNEPLGELFELLGHSPVLHSSDPGIVFHLSSGKIVRYHRDFENWMEELYLHFPFMKHRPFWGLIRKISKKSWALLKDVKCFPFTNVSDFLEVMKHPKYLSLVPYLLISTEHLLKKYDLYQSEYVELVNGILLISAQAESESIPALVGAMALSYPAETYAPGGGMKGLMDFFERELIKRNVVIKKKTPVSGFSEREIQLSSGEVIKADRVIMNIPVWNMSKMSEGEIHKKLLKESLIHPGHWGAFTVYFAGQFQIKELYQQVHLNLPDIKNYFVSFSVPEDESRAPLGYQCVSISTHVVAKSFINKEELTEIILSDFKKRFPFSDIKFLTTGSPKTFERYTGRENGFVGGIPFLYGKNPLTLMSPVLKKESLFRVGDTVFPGQGLCGVVAGSLQLHHRLKSCHSKILK
jgi:phytoene dehydrogenase-like protein